MISKIDRNLKMEDNCSFNRLMDEYDSDSDEEFGDSKDRRPLNKSQPDRDGEAAYHNLETFQKKQLKQKV